ncbi:EAL and modified HD-GYP domain-containing signal transduction protein [Malonomonas rubra DSM 5091]|uniref:EAL and modified HD-GYP domain-containing signal transduction protein n=1 Tax=Malonomonas rubra DSM 5091 TaxID=1122189 RepID=A0A1M6I5F2_MALRU|nr:EAL and modified HD-GYP domain-containing signal transduction protein [Malonomonas rubra DSM 5091]
MNKQNEILLASQPIYSKHKRLFAYELFFRHAENISAAEYGEEMATTDVLVNMCTGLSDHLDNNHRPVFVNFPADILYSDVSLPIAPENIIIELPAGLQVDKQTLDAVQKFKSEGFRFSLDSYNFAPCYDSLLEVIDYVKVDALAEQNENTQEKFNRVAKRSVVWVAERVETEAQYQKFLDLGFALFQGYFIAEPLQIEGQSLKQKAKICANTLESISHADIDIDKLCQIVAQNPYLATQLLKIINSPACALQRTISSLKEAIIYLGLGTVKNWIIMLSMLHDSSAKEGTGRVVLTRAKACEEYASTTVFTTPEKAFLVGLLSGVNLLFGIDNELFLKHSSLHEEITSAVLLRKGFLGQVLDEIIRTEHAIMQNPSSLKRDDDGFIGSFYLATNWVEKALNSISD